MALQRENSVINADYIDLLQAKCSVLRRNKKENIRQPELPDVFRRGENSCTTNIVKPLVNPLTKIHDTLLLYIATNWLSSW